MPRARKPALGYRWHLRGLMADAGLYATTELTPLLAERGIVLSQAQVYRLVTGTPERLSLRTLVALCDTLCCTANERIAPVVETKSRAPGTTGSAQSVASAAKQRTPRRAEIRQP